MHHIPCRPYGATPADTHVRTSMPALSRSRVAIKARVGLNLESGQKNNSSWKQCVGTYHLHIDVHERACDSWQYLLGRKTERRGCNHTRIMTAKPSFTWVLFGGTTGNLLMEIATAAVERITPITCHLITKVYMTHPVSVKSSHALLHSHTCIWWNSEFWVSVI